MVHADLELSSTRFSLTFLPLELIANTVVLKFRFWSFLSRYRRNDLAPHQTGKRNELGHITSGVSQSIGSLGGFIISGLDGVI
jgi:hypothetical protein